jgi:hypothetical protein
MLLAQSEGKPIFAAHSFCRSTSKSSVDLTQMRKRLLFPCKINHIFSNVAGDK